MNTPHINSIIQAIPAGHYWHDVLAALVDYDDASVIPLRTWMQGARLVTTLQATFDGGTLTRLWSPGLRAVDTSHASYVLLDGSRRDYAGTRCIKATTTTWLGYDANMSTYVIYQA